MTTLADLAPHYLHLRAERDRLRRLLEQQCRKLDRLGRPRLFTRSLRAWWRERRAQLLTISMTNNESKRAQ